MTKLTLETKDDMYQELKRHSVAVMGTYVENKETLTEDQVYYIVEEQLRDLELYRPDYQFLTDSEWEDLQEGVYSLICECCFEDEEFIPENLQELQ